MLEANVGWLPEVDHMGWQPETRRKLGNYIYTGTHVRQSATESDQRVPRVGQYWEAEETLSGAQNMAQRG